uniref:FERM domain-containing protein 6-like n=1 Tax=Erpetoichthys calabaricus TaxID=27687 RepID=A0A8C4T9H5_ERPCA
PVQSLLSIFIDLEQKLSKYFSKEWKKESVKGFGKSGPLFCVKFHVQYYVGNGRLISDRTARHLYYCLMKEKVLHSECTHKEEIYFLLAAYALQVDLGNYKKTVHIGKYFEPEAYFPHWIIVKRGCDYILKHTPKIHSEQQGRTAKEALLRFIKESCLLDDVPVHYYRLHKVLHFVHLSDLNNRCELLYDFPWSNVGRLTFLGKKFEILPDGLPSARKLVYYTGCPFRSRHLLHHLSNTHRLYLNIQPALKHIRKIEEAEEKKCYRESYISDTLEMDLEPLDKQSEDSRSSQGSNRNHRVSLQSISSHGSSGIEADSRHQMSVEMTVDEPFSLEPTHKSMKSFSSVISHGSSHTSGIEMCSKDRTEDDLQDDGEELLVFSSPDRHSQSLDDIRLFQQETPLSSCLNSETSQSYTFGIKNQHEKENQYGCTYSTIDCETKSTFYGKRSMNCLSLDLLGEENFLEFVV